MRYAPRSWFSLFVGYHGWIALGAGAAMLVFTGLSVVDFRQADQFARHGQPISAVVINNRVRAGDGRDIHYVTLRFRPPGGAYAIEKKVSEGYYANHPIGSETKIYYIPTRPHVIQTHATVAKHDAVLWQVLAGVMGCVGLCGLAWSGARATNAIKTRRYGLRVRAEVTRIDPVKNKYGQTSSYRLHWREDDGRFGRTSLLNERCVAGISAGAKIMVFRGPKKSYWEGEVGRREALSRPFPRVVAPSLPHKNT